MKTKKIIWVSFILFLLTVNFASAALVPCGRNEDDTSTINVKETDICTLCHLIVGFYNLISYGLRILIFAAFTVLVIAAVMYILSAGNEQTITTAKNAIKFTLSGMAFVLAAWLLVFVAMNYFGVKNNNDPNKTLGINKASWFTFDCKRDSSAGKLGQANNATNNTNEKKLCRDISGARCSSNLSCPWTYHLSNGLCGGGEVCCGPSYTSATKHSCEAFGGNCKLPVMGCGSGVQNNAYDCPPSAICCFPVSGPVEPPLPEKCEDRGGLCAICTSCPLSYQTSYYCSRGGCCCVGYSGARPFN